MKQWYELLLRLASRWRRFLHNLGITPGDAADGFLAERSAKLLQTECSEARLITAFRNYLIDLHRRRARSPVRLPRDQPLGDPAGPLLPLGGISVLESLERWPEGVRLIASLRPTEGKRDYGSALLLSERLKVLAAAAALVSTGDFPPPPSRIAETVYPWTEEEEERRIRAGTPALGEVWKTLADRVDTEPDRVFSDQHVATALQVTISTWQQWRHRGRNHAEQRFGRERLEQVVPTWRARGGGTVS